jgi:hypothetical protein
MFAHCTEQWGVITSGPRVRQGEMRAKNRNVEIKGVSL